MKNKTVDIYKTRSEMLKDYGCQIMEHDSGATTSSAPYFLVFYSGVYLKAYQEYRCTVDELKDAVRLAYGDYLQRIRNYHKGKAVHSKKELRQLECEIRKFRVTQYNLGFYINNYKDE